MLVLPVSQAKLSSHEGTATQPLDATPVLLTAAAKQPCVKVMLPGMLAVNLNHTQQ
jgi:hypothetical protein